MTATALHLSGEAKLDELRSIADVMTPKGAALLADSCENRLGGLKGRPAAARNVNYFNSIATRCGLYFSLAEREVLRDLKEDLFGYGNHGAGISARNLQKLLQFDDDDKFNMLIALPQVVMGELERNRRRARRPRWRQAQKARWALAVELLNTLPIRRQTLIGLDLARNFVKPSRGDPRLVIFEDQEKTGKMLEARLSAQTWRMLTLYRQYYRPLLPGAGRSSFLFPGRAGGHMAPQCLADGITRLVKERLGVHVNPHIWRHLMSSKLGESTGRSEDAEKLLGHAPGSRATRRYARLRSKLAAERLKKITERARQQGIDLLRATQVHDVAAEGRSSRRRRARKVTIADAP